MKTRSLFSICFAFVMVFGTILYADVRLPEIFGNNMVLQRDAAIPVWGWADHEENVSVTFGGQTVKTKTDVNGKWAVKLKPLKADSEPGTLIVKGKNEIKLDNILVGDVWLCSGQSNMEWPVSQSAEYKDQLTRNEINRGNIRIFQITKQFSADPKETMNITTPWTECSGKENENAIARFSAVGLYFGSVIFNNLGGGVPIGLINSSWGGTRIEPWTPPEGFQAVPALKDIAEEIEQRNPQTEAHRKLTSQTIEAYQSWLDTANEASLGSFGRIAPPPVFPSRLTPYTNQDEPTTIYNAMIYPLVPFAMKGIIWYQGEANVTEGMMYAEKMKALIYGWRTVFKNPDLGFYYVQLAPYYYGDWGTERLPELWEAQSSIEKTVPLTGQAVINDLVSNIRDIHPVRKKPVGERLALLAFERTYGVKKEDLLDGGNMSSPELDKMSISGNTITLSFKNADSLKTRDGKSPDWFEVAGSDGVYHQAEAVIDGTSIKLTSTNVAKPLAVRFAWNQIAEPNVQNESGLPLGAFRSGGIPERAVFDELVPDSAKFKLLYRFDPTNPKLADNEQRFVYTSDYTGRITGKVKRVGYFLHLIKGEESQYVFITMPPLHTDVQKLGVPVKAIGVRFQDQVNDVEVIVSNVPEVKPGKYDNCRVEFWETNYNQGNSLNIPGASSDKFDFGDQCSGGTPGYGSMQIHDVAGKRTLLAFNNFGAGKQSDVGIGNNPDSGGNPDWTFSHSSDSFSGGQFLIFVETE